MNLAEWPKLLLISVIVNYSVKGEGLNRYILTDFKNSFTNTLCRKFAIKPSSSSHHLSRVWCLPFWTRNGPNALRRLLFGLLLPFSKNSQTFVNTQQIVTKLRINIVDYIPHRSTVIDFWTRLLQLLRTPFPGP